ncbi:hypothetical protein ANO14919_145450 [Xylariales sp. No.14919]|nr:hypothetical protein ANO14919_145450 [Xylariales sp. No.14919]
MGYIIVYTGHEMESTDSPEDANGNANGAGEAELVEWDEDNCGVALE